MFAEPPSPDISHSTFAGLHPRGHLRNKITSPPSVSRHDVELVPGRSGRSGENPPGRPPEGAGRGVAAYAWSFHPFLRTATDIQADGMYNAPRCDEQGG